MQRQIKDEAVQTSRLLKGAAEPPFENDCIEFYLSQTNENISMHPDRDFTANPDGGTLAVSVFNAMDSHSRHTVSVWDVHPENRFTLRYANSRYLQINGKTDEAFGKKIEDLFPAKTVRRIRKDFINCVRHQREAELVHGLFGGRMFSTRILPQMDAGRVLRIICTGTDITDLIHEQNRLKTAGEQLERQGRMLGMRLKFESLLTQTLREFMDTGSAGFDGCLYGVNSELGKILGVDQALIFQKRTGDLLIHKAYWSRGGHPMYVSTKQIHVMQASGFDMAQITRLIAINDTHGAKAYPCAEELREMHIRALLAVPIRRESHEYGLICLVQMDRPRVWTTSEISLVKMVADVIMSAYQRLHLETGLRENVRVLTEYDESLQELLTQKETLAAVAQDFLRTGTRHFTECAHRTLGIIGRFLDADGVRLYVRTGEGDVDFFTWREDGLPCRVGYDRGGFDAALKNAAASLHTPIVVDDMAETHSVSDLVHAGQEEGMRSLLVVPSCRQDGLCGVIACYKAIGLKYWHRTDISSVETFIDIFLDAYQLKAQSETCDTFDVLLQR